MDQGNEDFNKKLKARFAQLPKVVQDAITSADVEKRLRALSEEHKLHLDQWEALENEVMLALLGFSPVEELAQNIQSEVKVPQDVAQVLAGDISRIVFEPIRQELERGLEHPEAKNEEKSGVEAAREQILANKPAAGSQQPAANSNPTTGYELQATSSVMPATPPQPPPTTKAERGPASGTYKPSETSTERKNIHDDPYREAPV